mgnify:CR=1 FL=1
MDYIPYTYLIGWSHLNKWYYGVETKQKKRKANPENLWKSYFTSSKAVFKMRKIYGEPDIVKVRKVFTSDLKAMNWEQKVLRRLKVVSSKLWINKSYFNYSLVLSPEIVEARVKTRKNNHKKWHSEEVKKKISEAKMGVSLNLSEFELLNRKRSLHARNLYDEEFIKKRNEGREKFLNNPINIEAIRSRSLVVLNSEESREKMRLAMQTSEYKEKRRVNSKSNWSLKAEKIKVGFNNYFSNPENIQKHSQRSIKMHQKRRRWDFIEVDGYKFVSMIECAQYLNRSLKWLRKQIREGRVVTHLEHPSFL